MMMMVFSFTDSNDTANSTTNSFTLPSVSFDNGLVEISALTTLIGSAAAVALVLGTRGPAGLAWSATSAFGMLGVVKACIGGASSGWLRETLGVRSAASDQAVGLQLDLASNSHSAKKVRKNMDRPQAISCNARFSEESLNREASDTKSSKQSLKRLGNDVYAFDYSTSSMISGVPDTEPDQPARVFAYARYAYHRKHTTKVNFAVIILSALKLVESYVLWVNGGRSLCTVSTIPWCYFFLAGILAESQEFQLAQMPETTLGNIDILAGRLPAVAQPGGSRKIILGASPNPKHSVLWTIMWTIGAMVCTAAAIMTYFILGKESKDMVIIWAGFQVLWLVLRLLVYHLVDPYDPVANRKLVDQSLFSLLPEMKIRIFRLVMALSKYQTYVHPRGDYAYQHDSFSPSDLTSALRNRYPLQYLHSRPVDQLTISPVTVDVKAVIGDTTLSSAAWVVGSKFQPMDLYDSCVLILSVLPSNISQTSLPSAPPSSTPSIIIPAARVLSGRTIEPLSASDPEKDVAGHFIPKGASNLGFGLSWIYWIPIEPGRWLLLSTEEDDLSILGRRKGVVVDDAEVSRRLAAGSLNIGFAHVDDVKHAVQGSRQALECLLKVAID